MNNIIYVIDLGTTTIECCLYDTDTKKSIASAYFKNPQSLYGSDVINRINACKKNHNNQIKMRIDVINLLKTNLLDMISSTGIFISDIINICICGNTTMIGILLDLDISDMGCAPFVAPYSKSIVCHSSDIFDDISNLSCEIIIPGCVSAFIGGDIISGVCYIEDNLCDEYCNYLFMDLGTNGEMVLKTNGKYYAGSAACGPAFENSLRRQGVFGSYAIDVLASCIKTKKIDKFGNLKDEYLEKGIDFMGVHLDSDIVRNIVLAKSALVTNIIMLFKKADATFDEINKVYLAGGFGFYLNIDSANYIGLIPKDFNNKISIVGNTSLKGGLNPDITKYDSYIDKIKAFQMANEREYEQTLINNMNFEV